MMGLGYLGPMEPTFFRVVTSPDCGIYPKVKAISYLTLNPKTHLALGVPNGPKNHLSYSLNSLTGDYIGEYYRAH